MKRKESFLNFVNSGRKAAFFVPILLGFLFSAASRFNETVGQFQAYDPAFLLNGCFYSALFTVVFLAAEKGLITTVKRREEEISTKEGDEVQWEFIAPSWKGMKRYLIVTVLCWIPTYLFLFPGIMMGDTAAQIEEYLNANGFTDWHPFLGTKIFGKFFTLGGISDPMVGVGIFIALQMILAACVTAYVAYYIQKVVRLRHSGDVATVLLCFYPMAPLSFMTMNKDTMFTVCFMLFCVLYCEIWRTRGTLFKRPSFVVAFILVALFTAYTKKTGSYIVGTSLMLMLFMQGKKALRFSAFAGGVVLVLFVQVFAPSIIYPQINVSPGPKQEMLAIPEQQLARIVRDSPEEFTEEERQIIDDVIAVGFDGVAENYDNYVVDPIKKTYVPNENSIGAFLKLWAKKGIEHPWQYIATEIGLQSGWLSFSWGAVDAPYTFSSPTSSEGANLLSDKVTWPEASAASITWNSWYDNLSKTPMLNLLMYVCIYATIIPFCIIFYLWRRAERVVDSFVSQIPLLLSMAMLFLCPTSTHARYMLPMMLTVPIFIAIITNVKVRR